MWGGRPPGNTNIETIFKTHQQMNLGIQTLLLAFVQNVPHRIIDSPLLMTLMRNCTPINQQSQLAQNVVHKENYSC